MRMVLEKALAPHSSTLAWKSHGQRSLVGCSPGGLEESDMAEWLHFHFSILCTGKANGNPLQCPCLENPRDGVAQSQTRLKWLSIDQVSSRMHSPEAFSTCQSFSLPSPPPVCHPEAFWTSPLLTQGLLWPRPCICPVGPILLPSGLSPTLRVEPRSGVCLSAAEREGKGSCLWSPGFSPPCYGPWEVALPCHWSPVFFFLMFGCAGSSLLRGPSLVVVSGGYSLLQCWASHCAGFPCRRAQTLGSQTSGAAVCGLRSWGSWAGASWLSSCGV